MKSASEKLNEVWQSVSAELYKAASEKARAQQGGGGAASEGQGQQEQSGTGGGKDEGPIIDAEVVDEKKP
jgi:molecular chaperone DnaK